MTGSRIVGRAASFLAALGAVASCTGHGMSANLAPATSVQPLSTSQGEAPATLSLAKPQAQSRTEKDADPAVVALAEASAVCNFDWRRSLSQRLAAAQRYATPAYAKAIVVAVESGQWQLTQHDRETGACANAHAYEVADAPNTAAVRYIRVTMTQTVRVNGGVSRAQQFAAQYRMERQPDGSWLIGAEGEGG